MNKKLTLAGFLFLAGTGFILLTAFGGKTLEQQKQEIAAAVTAKLDEFRAQKEEECTMRVTEEGQRRYDEYVASLPPEKPGKTTPKKKPATTKKDPLPENKPAETPTNRTRGDAVSPETNRERGDAVNPAKPGDNRRRGDAVKKEGGGN